MKKVSCLAFVLLLVLSLTACVRSTYQSSAVILITVNTEEEITAITSGDIVNEELITEAISIMESQQVLEKVSAELDDTITTKELVKCVAIEAKKDVMMIQIAVEGNSASQTEEIAKCYLAVAIESIEQQIKDAEVKLVDNVITKK